MGSFLRRIPRHGRIKLAPFAACLLLLVSMALPLNALAIQNSAVGSVNATPLNISAATVTLQRTAGTALTSALAEISPTTVLTGKSATQFTYSILPTIQPTDAGLSALAITAPAGYANLATTMVMVGVMPLSAKCPAPGAGEYCANTAGTTITVSLGTRVTVDQTPIRVIFTADTC